MYINIKFLDNLGDIMDNCNSILVNSKYYCNCCQHNCVKKCNYERHMNSAKHIKTSKLIEQNTENEQIDRTKCQNEQTVVNKNKIGKYKKSCIETKYCCDYCKFSTKCKKESEKHRKSKQHIKNENKEEDFLEITNEYTCLNCENVYKKYKSCWDHSSRCKGKKENIIFTVIENSEIENLVIENPEIENPVIENPVIENPDTELNIPCSNKIDNFMEIIVDKMLDNKGMMEIFMNKMVGIMEKISENNQNIVEKIAENNQNVVEKIAETMSQNHTTVIQNNNTTNNHCTINLFLNDKCRDAINITDWVNNIVINYDNLYYNAEHGFQKGLTKILVDNLNLLSKYKRPIHFTDLKRDIMYIKDADEWTKHDNNDKLVETLDSTARKGICCFAEWLEANTPAYHNLDSHLGQLYMKIHQSIIQKQMEKDKAFPKVLKEVARTAYLAKDEQV